MTIRDIIIQLASLARAYDSIWKSFLLVEYPTLQPEPQQPQTKGQNNDL